MSGGTFTLLGFASHLAGSIVRAEAAKQTALERAATMVETTAKEGMGTYEFGWPALQPETIARKQTGDSPLVESGELRDSIEHNVSTNGAAIGTNNEKAVWQFLGTATIPPRDPLVPACREHEHEIVHMLGHAAVSGLIEG